METDILDSLNDLGYEGPLTDETAFMKALDGGPKSLEFTKLVHILAEEIKQLCNLEETVNIMDDPDESVSFLLELSSFLKELGCPYKKLVTGHMSSRLQTKEDRVLLLDYLVSELMAARMVNIDRPKEKQGSGMEIIVQESPTAKDLKEILISLKFNKPPPNITAEMLFAKLESKLKDTLQKEGDQLVGKPLYNKALSDKDWKQLEISFTEMFEEYRLRRETLITRLECTIQSFEWSDRLKTKKDHIQSTYRPKREQLKVKPNVKLSDFLAARTSLLQVEKTSSATVRKNTQSEVNKVIIGQVPDRGGRPNEQQPPPPEMPSWQQQRAPQGPGDDTRVEQAVPKKLKILAKTEKPQCDMSNKTTTAVGAVTSKMIECNDRNSDIVELSNIVKKFVDTGPSGSVTAGESGKETSKSVGDKQIINVESSSVKPAKSLPGNKNIGESGKESAESVGDKRIIDVESYGVSLPGNKDIGESGKETAESVGDKRIINVELCSVSLPGNKDIDESGKESAESVGDKRIINVELYGMSLSGNKDIGESGKETAESVGDKEIINVELYGVSLPGNKDIGESSEETVESVGERIIDVELYGVSLPENKNIGDSGKETAESVGDKRIINVESSAVKPAELIKDCGSFAKEITITAGVKRSNAASFFKDVSEPHREKQSNHNVKGQVRVVLPKNIGRNRRQKERKQRRLMRLMQNISMNLNLSNESSSIENTKENSELMKFMQKVGVNLNLSSEGPSIANTKENSESTTQSNLVKVVAEINNRFTERAHSSEVKKRLRNETDSEVSESSTGTAAKLVRHSEDIGHSSQQGILEIEPYILELINSKESSSHNDNQVIIKMVIMPEGYPKTTFECKMLATIQLLFWTKLELTSDPLPRFCLEGILNGVLHIRCLGQDSAIWLYKNYDGQIIDGIKVKVAPTKSLNLVKMSWKTENICIQNVHRLLLMMQRVNPGLRTSEWKVVSTDINESRVKRIVYVDRLSANYIKLMGYKLKGGICVSFFKLLDDNVM